jgi:cobalt/nickel transport system permease protein
VIKEDKEMHMADALLSPAVGGAFYAASAAALAVSAKKLKDEGDEHKVPLMGVLGAFVFAAQMINFTIPGTGSSGHIGGGTLLAFLQGPYAAFITITSVLIVQALFFADGGILALGANAWNLGFYPALVWMLMTRFLARRKPARAAFSLAAVIAAVVGRARHRGWVEIKRPGGHAARRAARHTGVEHGT